MAAVFSIPSRCSQITVVSEHTKIKTTYTNGFGAAAENLDAPQWNRFNKATGFTGLSPPLEKARATKYYADDFIINFSARRLGLNLLIFDEVSDDVYLFLGNKRNGRTCFRWIKRCHFEPIADICTQGKLCPHKMSFVGDRFPYANSGFFRGIVDPKTSFLAKRFGHIRQAGSRNRSVER